MFIVTTTTTATAAAASCIIITVIQQTAMEPRGLELAKQAFRRATHITK